MINQILYANRGDTIRFWLDGWLYDEPMRDRYPSLFQLATNKICFVQDNWAVVGAMGCWVVSWSTELLENEVEEEWLRLSADLQTDVGNRDDIWSWLAENDGFFFTVK